MSDTRLEAFRQLERERLRTLVEARHEDAKRLHAPGYQLITPGGAALDREAYLGGIATGALRYLVFEPASPIQVLSFGDGVAVRYQARIEVRFGDGGADGGLFWHTDLYRRTDDGWQVVWSQATRIARGPGEEP
ncbi:MAG TPA: nuclear transport factor 2 family protein [Candidatus Limnocylindrales bacterium]|nr:nuclear transport factor 2 family protein [Candidatus Limnocylindrales bacterium]